MSLETALQETTVAIRELISHLAANGMTHQAAVGTVIHQAVEQAAEKPAAKKEVKAETKPATAAAKPQATEQAEDVFTVGGSALELKAPELQDIRNAKAGENDQNADYKFVRFAILTVAKEKGRETTDALLSRYGVKKGQDLKPEQYAGVITDIDAIFTGAYDPIAAEVA